MTEWTVPAIVKAIVDGDTLKLDLDLGWGIWLRDVNVRLYGIDAPEMNTVAGRDARIAAMDVVQPGWRVTFISKELDKYGRPLGKVILPGGADLALHLLQRGHGVPYFGGRRVKSSDTI